MRKLSVMLISVLLISCNNKLPKPPEFDDCAILKRDSGEFYLHCVMSNDSTKEWELTIPEGHGYLCTHPDSRAKAEKYRKELESWVNKNCNSK